MTPTQPTPCPHAMAPGMAEAIQATRAALQKIDARLASGFDEAITRLQFDRMLRTQYPETRKEVAA